MEIFQIRQKYISAIHYLQVKHGIANKTWDIEILAIKNRKIYSSHILTQEAHMDPLILNKIIRKAKALLELQNLQVF